MRRRGLSRPTVDYRSDHARVPLCGRGGVVKAWAVVDIEDADEVAKWSWCMTASGYAMTKDGPRYIYLHRVICPGEGVADHIDGDRLNCRRSNLRLCSQRDNCRNKRQVKPNTVGLKGVSLAGDRFRARIMVDRREIALGRFDCPVEAARAYDRAAQEHFGEFACVNFADGPGVLAEVA